MHELRRRAGNWVESAPVQRIIIVVIVANAVTLGLETSSAVMDRAGGLIHALDAAFLTVFVVEIALKLFAHGWGFFRDPWNVFDFLIVGVALVPASGPFSVLRALRVLRVLRLVSVLPRLRFIVEALLAAIPGIGAIGALLALIFYVAAVMATSLFGDTFPEWFGSIGDSLYTLFQVMTLESWSMGIVRPVMEVHPWAWTFFVTFILLSSFTILNLFIAVIVDTMQTLHDRDRAVEAAPDGAAPEHPKAHAHVAAVATTAATDEILAELQRLHARIDELSAR
ncbi:ion transporter [Nocardioides sambongensis]|uniref:ion transporter n=1 Tax=Nocardioides sambongensis TaxID=2589074 RepID=UPI0011273D98|nr:ion transporter [Nocardioides sambongensis]